MHLTKSQTLSTKNDEHLLFSYHKLIINTFGPEKESIFELCFVSKPIGVKKIALNRLIKIIIRSIYGMNLLTKIELWTNWIGWSGFEYKSNMTKSPDRSLYKSSWSLIHEPLKELAENAPCNTWSSFNFSLLALRSNLPLIIHIIILYFSIIYYILFY